MVDNDTSASDVWGPYTSLKLSVLDNCASNANIEMEDGLPYMGESELSGEIIDMIVNLDNCDI